MLNIPILHKVEYICRMNLKEYIPYYKRNLNVALPVMLTQAGQVSVHLADNIMVGHLGTAELASVLFANSIFILGMVFGIGFTQGLTPHIGQNFGKGDHEKVTSFFQNSLALNFLTTIILTGVMYVAGLFMSHMGQHPEVVENAYDYYDIILPSMIPFLMFFGIRQFSEGIGITKYAMYITIAGNLMNIFLNWVLIYGHLGCDKMGVAGAALATLISRIFMLAAFCYILYRVSIYKQYVKRFKKKLFDKLVIKDLLKTSVPLSFQNLIEITAFSLSAIMVGWTGKSPLAAHQIAMSMSSFSFMLALGVGAAATIRVSHQYGFGDYVATRKAGFAAIHLSVALMSISGICYILFKDYIPFIYTTDLEVVKIASSLLIISALFQIFDAIQLSCIACLRALSDVKIPLILSVIAYYFVCLPLGYVCGFVFEMGAVGVWIGLLLGLIFVALLFLWRFNKITNYMIKHNTANFYHKL